MNKKLIFVAIVFFLSQLQAASLYSAADLELVRQAIEVAHDNDLAYNLISSLTTEVGPRPAGSPADLAAVKWAKRKFEELGFDKVWLEPVKLSAWKRGPANAEVTMPFPQSLAVAALGNSVSTPEGGLTAEIIYYKNYSALVSDNSMQAKGKIVFIDEHTERTRDGSGYSRAVQARFSGAVEAARKGAIAVVIRSIGTDYIRLPHTGTMSYDTSVKKIPAVTISIPDADQIKRMVDTMLTVTLHLDTQNKSVENAESFNVIAEITGSDKVNQVVAIGAHLDSWDLGTGAIDDGTGVGITMAAVKILKDLSVSLNNRPKRTLRVVLFANEENGLDGARAYSEVHKNEKHQIVSESDLGTDAIYRLETRVDADARRWLAELKPFLSPLNIEFGGNNGGTGSDFGFVARENNLPQAGFDQDATNYFDIHHTANDTLDKINKAGLNQNVAAMTALVWLSAQAGIDFKAQ